jgi:2,6-dihydroxypseudooxynicotine hydrolase
VADLLRDVLLVHGGRLTGDGVPAADVAAAEATLTRWEDWFEFWSRRARSYEELGDRALASGRRQSAGMLYWYGSMAWHYAQFLWFHDLPVREEGQQQKVRLYQLASPHLVPPAIPFRVSVQGIVLSGWLRLPSGAGRCPCVILLGGLESTKEESLLFEQLCLSRGLATCAFDGPGQGECYFQARLRPDFERFTAAVVDFLEWRPEIDSSRIGILGRSLGGYYAVRCAALDERLRACVAWGALFDLSHYRRMHRLTQLGFAYVAGHASQAEAEEYLQTAINLDGVAEHLRCPLYVLHGGQDHLMPAEQVERLRKAVTGAPETVWDVPPDGNHCCHNLSHIVRPRMADWLAARLGGRL